MDPIGETEATAAIPLGPSDATWFSKGASDGTIYFSSRGGAEDGYLIVVDTDTNTIARVSLTKIDPFAVLFLAGVALSPDERELYCAVFEGTDPSDTAAVKFLVVLDRATLTEIGRVPLRGGGNGRLRDIAVTPDGRRAFVPAHDNSAIHVVDLVARTEIDTDGIGTNGITPMSTATARPGGAALNNDGSRLYVGHSGGRGLRISVFNTASLTEIAAIPSMAVGNSTGPDLAFNLCDERLYAGRVQLDSDADPAISVFDPGTAQEAFVEAPGNGFAGFRDVAFVWGTSIAASGSTVTNSVILFDTTNLSPNATVTATSVTLTGASNAHTVATIPPVRN